MRKTLVLLIITLLIPATVAAQGDATLPQPGTWTYTRLDSEYECGRFLAHPIWTR